MVRTTSALRYCVILTLLTLIFISPLTLMAYSDMRNEYGILQKFDLYLLDYGYVVVASDRKAYFEMPLNYSDGNFNQSVFIVRVGGNSFVNHTGTTASIGLVLRNLTDAYMFLKIRLVMYNFTKALKEIVRNPYIFNNSYVIPSHIVNNYIRKPVAVVRDVVVRDFERWLRNKLNVSINEVSKAYIALAAAYFIYRSGYIKYSPSAFARTVEDVVKYREGDCDDMSRVLMNLLWYYGIPAKIEYGYVYLPIDLPIPVENSMIYFRNAGPHGYVVAYIPPLGWVSLDLLAGARLRYPVVVTGYDVSPDVSVESVNEARRFNRVNVYSELVELMEPSELSKKGLSLINDSVVRNYSLSIIGDNVISQIRKYLCKPLILTITKTQTKAYVTNVTKTLTLTLTKTVTKSVPKECTKTEVRTVVRTIERLLTRTATMEVSKVSTIYITETAVKVKTVVRSVVPTHITYSLIALIAIIAVLASLLARYWRR